MATVLEIMVNLVMSTHIYVFCGKYFLQRLGGPIGLRSTATIAALIMKLWDQAWVRLLEKENLGVLEFFRYVDESGILSSHCMKDGDGQRGHSNSHRSGKRRIFCKVKLTRLGLPVNCPKLCHHWSTT